MAGFKVVLLRPFFLLSIIVLASGASAVRALAYLNGQDMPGMPMPAAKPKTEPSPAQTRDEPKTTKNPSPETAKPATDPHQMNQRPPEMTNMEPGNPSSSASMKIDMGSLIEMDGEDMKIRVGQNPESGLSMAAMGSGTSVLPASSGMNMYHHNAGNWLLMFHFNAVGGLNVQGGPRGETKVESQNWFMPMAYHKLGPGTIQLKSMLSFEPFTFPAGGSGQLFQTGESYKGHPIIDKQHPHDLFMELSATYTVPVSERLNWFAYFGYPGEPALGPVAFMHRQSASENPSAPLAHHLEDSTHISFGVFTTGITFSKFKLEGSVFNGREPDEHRYNFEAHSWDSKAGRLSWSPARNWALQVSYGFLRGPEELEPGTDIHRATASIEYTRPFAHGTWASSLIWGRNHTSNAGETANLNGYTAESTINFQDKNYIYTRLELVDKNELLRPEDKILIGIPLADRPVFRIGGYTVGASREILNTSKLSVALGGDLTLYSKPDILTPLYGNHPASYRFFFRIRPAKMKMDNMRSDPNQMNGSDPGKK